MTASIIGWAHSKFGKLENEDLESLIVKVSQQAIEDAGVEPHDIDAIFIGHCNAGLTKQIFPSSLVLQADDGLRFKESTRVENACATGTAAVHQAVNYLRAKRGKLTLVVGVEKMTDSKSKQVGDALIRASYMKEESDIEGGFPGVFGRITEQYFQKYGNQTDTLAKIAAKNHRNGCSNPYAHMQKDLGYEFCRTESDKNPFVAGPLKRTDCSLISDGAAAVVIADLETSLAFEKAVLFRATQQVNDFLPMSRRDMTHFEGAELAWKEAFSEASISLEDLDIAETHDCFTIAELIQYEAMGLTPKGQGARAIQEGWTEKGGRLPINASGGLKAKGHPIGATGVSMHIMCCLQLKGLAGEMQVEDVNLAGLFNMGGAAVANYVSILEAIR